MRILMLSQFYPPFVVGGEELMVAATSRGLAARGHEVAVVTLAVEGAPPFERDEGVDVHRITSSSGRLQFLYTDVERPHVPPFPDPEVAYRVNRLIAELRPDIVHGHNWLLRSVLPLRIPAATRVVATLHDYGRICATRRLMRDGAPCDGPGAVRCPRCARAHYGLVKGWVTAATNAGGSRWEHHKVDLYLAISEAVAERSGLAELRVPHRVISNFLPDAFPGEETGVGPTPDDGPIVFVGDAVHDKGIETLLEAYATLADPPELVLVGRDGDLGDRALPPGVRRAGLVPHDGVGAFWRGASIAVVPSLWPEPFGLVALEAAAYGRPLVASRTGGLVDLVLDGRSGLLVPPGDAPALAAAIGRLLDDPPLGRRMGLAGLEHSRSFRASSVLPRLEAAYSEVLAA